MKQVSKHLYRNANGNYYFRIAVPVHQRILLGKHEVKFSLKTKELCSALKARETYRAFFELRFHETNNTMTSTAVVAPTQPQLKVRYHFNGTAYCQTIEEVTETLQELHTTKSALEDQVSRFYTQLRIEQTTEPGMPTEPSPFSAAPPSNGELDDIQADIDYANAHIKAIERGLQTQVDIRDSVNRLIVVAGHQTLSDQQNTVLGQTAAPAPAPTPTQTFTILKLAARFIRWKKSANNWSEANRKYVRPKLKLLIEILGNRDVHQLTRDDAQYVFTTLQRLPLNLTANREKGRQLEGLSLKEVAALTHESTLSGSTVNHHTVVYRQLFSWAVDDGILRQNLFSNIPKLGKRDLRDARDAFSDDDLKALLGQAVFTHWGASRFDRPFHYWGILLCLTTGARVNEIMSL
jgi:hypothetical protein